MVRLNWLQYRQFGELLATFNLTLPQFHALSTLHTLGGFATIGSLARIAREVSATMTGIVDRLEHGGLVIRERSEDDRRSIIVRITPRGEKALANALQHTLESVGDLLATVPPSDQVVLNRLVDHMVASYEAELVP